MASGVSRYALEMEERLFSEGSPASGRYARIAVARSVDYSEGLTYAIPSSLDDLVVGERVEAPLGRGNALSEGFVVDVDVAPDLDPARIKPIARRTGARLPASLVELARWMAGYYFCPLGMVLTSMLPAAVKRGTGRIRRVEVELTGEGEKDGLSPAALDAWRSICELPRDVFPLTAKELSLRIGVRSVAPINRIIRAGLLREVERTRIRAAWAEHAVERPRELSLHPDQERAIERVCVTLGAFHQHLVFGVTGSGKTEVYLRIIERVLQHGECAIVLVPEISLTPQTAGRFLGWFGKQGVAVLHSGLTQSQRHQQWAAVRDGDARVVIGARSAVFSPFDASAGGKVGVIIVDEEHDGAYKQDEPAPRYHGRDVAIKRAQIDGCPVVLGSATPSLESWHNARQGRSSLHQLPERAGGASMPTVQVVDLAKELRALADERSRVRLIGPTLRSALGETLDDGGQAVLLLNRRGYANYICCPDQRCGWIMVCERCDSTMVLHKGRELPRDGVVRCHHCQDAMKLPPLCPVCSRKVVAFGMGTQRVEEELRQLFPALEEGVALRRLDSDALQRASDWHEALEQFANQEIRVLLGTQMIGKGLDFPNVRLVGVINADTAINLPDFRAAERTFQLVSQVAGRAGRASDKPGRVIVQSFNPQAPAVRLAARHDYVAFADLELAGRERDGLPPAGRMVRMVIRDKDYAKASAAATELAHAIRELRKERLRVRGPMPCPISRVAEFYRFSVEAIAPSPGPLHQALTTLRNSGRLKSDARMAVDVDPYALL